MMQARPSQKHIQEELKRHSMYFIGIIAVCRVAELALTHYSSQKK
jgi:hypothetical protein